MSSNDQDERPRSLKHVRSQVAATLGPGMAPRVQAFRDGTLYVEPGWAAVIWAWLVDFVLVTSIAVGVGVAYYVSATDTPDAGAGASVIILALLVVVPLLYGWFYGNGRGLGALMAGTRLVRMKDGGRIGLWKAGWAMLIRTLGFVIIVLGALGGSATDASEVRVSIDVHATERLRAAGFHRLASQ